MALATASPDGMPSVRIVLLKGIDDRGPAVLHQLRLAQGPRARRQPARGGDDLLGSRCTARCARRAPSNGSPRRSRTRTSPRAGAGRGSARGRPSRARRSRSRDVLEARVRRGRRALPGRRACRGPDYWGGYRLVPDAIELWQGRAEPAARPRALPARRRRELAVGAPVAVTWLGGPLDVDGLAVVPCARRCDAAAELAEARGLRPPGGVAVGGARRGELHLRAPRAGARRAGGRGLRAAVADAALRGRRLGAHARQLPAPRRGAVARARHRAPTPRSSRRPRRRARRRRARGRGRRRGRLRGRAAHARPSGRRTRPAPRSPGPRSWMAGRGAAPRGRRCPRPQRRGTPPTAAAARPAAGLRVLDLTRVIAGPVAGRTLAALGAEVLRIDPPALPEMPEAHLDTGPGKRSRAARPRRRGAPRGAARRRRRAADRLPRRRRSTASSASATRTSSACRSAPGATAGPWASRRGFDSLVQVASGIAAACAAPDGTPGVLPAQALDHGTGHLMAAAALPALAARERGEGGPLRPALARPHRRRAARRPALATTPRPARPDPDRFRVAFGDVELIAPPGALDGDAARLGPRPAPARRRPAGRRSDGSGSARSIAPRSTISAKPIVSVPPGASRRSRARPIQSRTPACAWVRADVRVAVGDQRPLVVLPVALGARRDPDRLEPGGLARAQQAGEVGQLVGG